MHFLLLLIFLHILSCNANEAIDLTEKNKQKKVDKTTDSIQKKDTTKIIPVNNLYSLLIDTNTISLRQWDSTLQIVTLLGPPSKERIRQLDQNSDTHSGSFIKDLWYDGLKLKMFSPSQNGKRFWVQEMILTSSRFQTSRQVTLGDSLQKVKIAYPEMKKFPGNTDYMYYVADSGYENSIEMEFKNDRLVKLRMYYMIP